MINFLQSLSPVAFNLGPFSVRWYGIIIMTGVIVAVLMATSEAKKRQIMPDDIIDLLFFILPIGFIGARLYYVAFQWPEYAQDPAKIFMIWQGGIAIYGGLIAGLITLIVYTYYRHLPTWLLLDVITPGVMLAQIMGRWGNFMNQEAYGAVTSLDFLKGLHLPDFIIQQMFIDGAYRQPTFLYESFFNLIGLILILVLRHKHVFKQGEVALSYVLWYSIVRFFVEGMRTDSLLLGSIRVSQALSAILFVVVVGIMIYRRKVVKPKEYIEGSGFKFPYKS